MHSPCLYFRESNCRQEVFQDTIAAQAKIPGLQGSGNGLPACRSRIAIGSDRKGLLAGVVKTNAAKRASRSVWFDQQSLALGIEVEEQLMNSVRNKGRLFLPAALMLGITASTPTIAQSIVVEGLQILFKEADSETDFEDVEQQARWLHEELGEDLAELTSLQEAAENGGFLFYDEVGNAVAVSEAEVRDLADTLARDLALATEPYAHTMALLLRGQRGGDLDLIVANSILGLMAEQDELRRMNTPLEAGDLLPVLTNQLLALARSTDRSNRDMLDQNIRDLIADRDRVLAIADAANTAGFNLVFNPPVPEQPEGFMNDAGYWVVQRSGSGWHKNGAGRATRIVGYENFIIQVTEEVSEPAPTRFLWQLPPGYDILEFERSRQEAARETSRESCANLPTLGPRNPAPSIWEDGPHYEIVQGPIADWDTARDIQGNSRLSNNDPLGSRFWDHESGFSHEDLDPVCERYGVSLTS